MVKKIIHSTNAPAPIGPYNQAIEANGFIFISGQIALNAESNTLILDSIEEETEQVMQNLKAILTEAGIDFDHVIKTSIFLSDMAYFSTVNTTYSKYFTKDFPARETVQVAGLPRNVNVEISMIAIR
jgi:2-iminobutanoate/2-iminopropanoate deaminase